MYVDEGKSNHCLLLHSIFFFIPLLVIVDLFWLQLT